MNKTFIFSKGVLSIIVVLAITFSINFSMAFPQQSDQNMMMDQSSMMHQLNQMGMMGMEPPVMMGQGMMPCIVIGPMMIGNQIMMSIMPCIMMNPGMMGPMMGPQMMNPGMMGPMNQTEMMGMEQ